MVHISDPEPGSPQAVEAFLAAAAGGADAVRQAGEIGGIVVGRRAELVLADLDDPSYVPLDSAARQLVHPEDGRAGRTVIVDAAR